MKKTIITVIFVAATSIAFSQKTITKNYKHVNTLNIGTPEKITGQLQAPKDTIVYCIYGDKDLNKLYETLSAGYQGVMSSDNFSVNARKDYAARLSHIDSLLRPQIKKYHPEPVKKP